MYRALEQSERKSEHFFTQRGPCPRSPERTTTQILEIVITTIANRKKNCAEKGG